MRRSFFTAVTAEAHGSYGILGRLHTTLADMTGDPSIFFHASSRHSKVFQILLCNEFPRSSQPDEIYSVTPLAGSGVYPEVSSLLDVPGRCSANFLLRWLKPPQRRTTPLLHHFSTLVAAQTNKSNALAPLSASLLPQQSRKTHKLSSFAFFFFLKKSPGCFNLFPQGQASPMKREIKHFQGEKGDGIPEQGATPTTQAPLSKTKRRFIVQLFNIS